MSSHVLQIGLCRMFADMFPLVAIPHVPSRVPTGRGIFSQSTQDHNTMQQERRSMIGLGDKRRCGRPTLRPRVTRDTRGRQSNEQRWERFVRYYALDEVKLQRRRCAVNSHPHGSTRCQHHKSRQNSSRRTFEYFSTRIRYRFRVRMDFPILCKPPFMRPNQ
jgi:hypothetical protein